MNKQGKSIHSVGFPEVQKEACPLTESQLQLLRFINATIDTQGYPPSLREMLTGVHLKSTAHVSYLLDGMAAQGYISRDPKVARGIRVLKAVPSVGSD